MSERWDVVIVGAGPAGLFVRDALARRGLRTLLLEAGPALSGAPPMLPPDDAVWPFASTGETPLWYRVVGLGGRSLLWGGWMNRFSRASFEEGGWPYGARALARHYTAAERWAGARSSSLPARYAALGRSLGIEVAPKRAATRLARGDGTRAAKSARTCTIGVSLESSRGRAEALHVHAGDGESLVRADAFVLAASPIETYRLLRASGVDHPALGRGLHDHATLSFALVERAARGGARPSRVASAWLPRLDRATTSRGGRAFCVEIVGRMRPDQLSSATRAEIGADDGARVTLLLGLAEQRAHKHRYVDLAPGARDALGRPVPRLHLAASRDDARALEDMRGACIAVADAIAAKGSELVPLHDASTTPTLFHPAGTCCMGHEADAPCDPYGRLRALSNVWIADASVFPSPGDCHPTLTLLAHANRLVERLVSVCTRGPR